MKINKIFITLGASNHTDKERELNDYYATDPIAIDILMSVEKLNNVLEPSCGEGHLSKRMIENGVIVTSSDLIDRGYGNTKDFFSYSNWNGDIVTNPPYKLAIKFIEHSLKITKTGSKICMFLKLQFLESKLRKLLFTKFPPKTLYVSSSRILCAKNGDFAGMINGGGSAVAYGWFVWENGNTNDTIIKWVN